MKRLLSILLLLFLPLVVSYPISDYTGGNVYIMPGKEVNILLPFPKGTDCLPVAVLWVEGGKDYPEININGKSFRGGGVIRTVLSGDRVFITARSSLPSVIEGNSLIYCTRDPFVFIEYSPPVPIEVGNYNYIDVYIKNYGYSPTEVNLLYHFHPDLAPYFPPKQRVYVPARKKGTSFAFVSFPIFTVSAPFVKVLSSHPRICITYRDSLGKVVDCAGPVPTRVVIKPLFTCIRTECYNTSNMKLELNGQLILPGDKVSEYDLKKLREYNVVLRKINFRCENVGFEDQTGSPWYYLVGIGLLFAVILSVVFK